MTPKKKQTLEELAETMEIEKERLNQECVRVDKNLYANGEHAKLSLSATKQWLKCPGSIVLGEDCPEKESSVYAEEGTHAHDLCERVLIAVFVDGLEFEKAWKAIAEAEASDKEMALHVKGYCESIFRILKKFPAVPGTIGVEEKFCLSEYYSIYGTADFSYVHQKEDGTCIGVVIDFKYGQGLVVEVKDNYQLASYGIGLMLRYPEYDFDRVTVGIYQPRCFHKDGPFRLQPMPAEFLDERTAEILDTAKHISEMFETGTTQDDFFAGDHCTWCRAAAVCKTKAKMFGEVMLQPELQEGKVTKLPDPEQLTDQQLCQIVQHRTDIERWFKRIEEYGIGRFYEDKAIEGTKVVEGRSSRKWLGKDHEIAAALIAQKEVVDPWDKKLRAITSIEKEIGKGNLGDLTVKKPGKPKLTFLEDSRKAISQDYSSLDSGFDGE